MARIKGQPLPVKMEPQPSWPEGNEPDKITNVRGGFVDGKGVRISTPLGRAGCEGIKLNDEWWWVKNKVETQCRRVEV